MQSPATATRQVCQVAAVDDYQISSEVKIGTDVAASEFYTAEKKHYDLDFKNPSSPADALKHQLLGPVRPML